MRNYRLRKCSALEQCTTPTLPSRVLLSSQYIALSYTAVHSQAKSADLQGRSTRHVGASTRQQHAVAIC
jgi:hypothetical protein